MGSCRLEALPSQERGRGYYDARGAIPGRDGNGWNLASCLRGGIKKRKEKLKAQREETGQGPVPARQPGRKSPK